MRTLLLIALLLALETAFAAGRFVGPIIVGDSWINNELDWPGYTVSVTWPEYFPEGKGGEWLGASVYSPFGGVVTNIDDYLNTHTEADSVIILGGINDFRLGASATEVQAALTEIVAATKTREYIRNIIVMSPGPFGGYANWHQSGQDELELYLAWLPGFCITEAIICYDTYTAVGDPLAPSMIAAAYDGDGLHVNESGAIRIAMDLDQVIEEQRNRTTTVAIQVLPWSSVAVIDATSSTAIPVVIYNTTLTDSGVDHFDPVGVDPGSLQLGSAGNISPTPLIVDADGDQRMDSVYLFKPADIGLLCADTSVELTGQTYDGEQFVGFDLIETSGCDGFGCHP